MKKLSVLKRRNIGLHFGCIIVTALCVLLSSITVFAETPATSGDSSKLIVVAQAGQSWWKVYCKRNDGTVVYVDTTQIGWVETGYLFYAGPYKTAAEAKAWIAQKCPSGLCDSEGRCKR
jgi:hypothetical protein